MHSASKKKRITCNSLTPSMETGTKVVLQYKACMALWYLLRCSHVLATWLNCIQHAVQNVLENASISTFGKHGMNNYAPLKLWYQAIMLMLTVKKKRGIQILCHYIMQKSSRKLCLDRTTEQMKWMWDHKFGISMDESWKVLNLNWYHQSFSLLFTTFLLFTHHSMSVIPSASSSPLFTFFIDVAIRTSTFFPLSLTANFTSPCFGLTYPLQFWKRIEESRS